MRTLTGIFGILTTGALAGAALNTSPTKGPDLYLRYCAVCHGKDGKGGGPAHRQWVRFLAANAFGFTLNRGTYALLVTFVAVCAAQPIFATAAGAIAGMFLNFSLSRAMVFR